MSKKKMISRSVYIFLLMCIAISSLFIVKNSNSVVNAAGYSALFESTKNIHSVQGKTLHESLGGENGVEVTAGANAITKLKNPINLSQLSKTDNVIALQIYGGDNYKSYTELSYITIRLTDMHDSANSLQFRFTQIPPIAEWNKAQCYFLAGFDNKNMWGYDFYYSIYQKNMYGSTIRGSFIGKSSETLRFQFDNADNSVFLNSVDNLFGTSQKAIKLDDTDTVGAGNEWKGFKTGEVYLQIEFPNFTGNAGIVVTEIAGQKLDESLADTVAPYLQINENVAYVDNLPDAQMNKPYKIPTANSFDLVDGACEITRELFEAGSDTPVAVQDNLFTPTKLGDYRLVYSATDKSGNTKNKELTFTIVNSISPIRADFIGNVEIATVGVNYTLPQIEVQGGSGLIEYDYNITFKDRTITTADVILFESGTLKYNISAKDYLSLEPVELNLHIFVVASTKPIVTINGVPEAVLSGSKVTFPDFSAIDYSKGGVESGKSIYVNGTRLEANLEYTVSDTENGLNVAYVAGIGQNQVINNYFVSVLKPTDISDYFLTGGNITKALTSDGTLFETDRDDKIKLPFQIVAEGFLVNFNIISSKSNFEYIDIYLEDYNNIYNKFFLRYSALDNVSCYLQINGTGAKYKVSGSFSNTSESIKFVYLNGTICTTLGEEICRPEKTVSGGDFNGFSGTIRTSISFVNVSGASAINLFQIGNQTFSTYSAGSNIGPQVLFSKPFANKVVACGSIINVPSAKAYAVLAANSEITMSMTDPDGIKIWDNISCENDNSFVTNKFGRYTVTFTAKSSALKISKFDVNITSADMQAPQISVSGSLGSEYKIGDTISIPDASVIDNYDDAPVLKIFLFSDNMMFEAVSAGQKIKLSKSGNFRLVYYSFDSGYNTSEKVIIFTVKN